MREIHAKIKDGIIIPEEKLDMEDGEVIVKIEKKCSVTDELCGIIQINDKIAEEIINDESFIGV